MESPSRSLQDLLADLTSGDENRAEAAVPALLALGESACAALVALTRSLDADQRWWAIRALAQAPQTRTEDLIPLLSDPSADVRAAAALAICNHPGEVAIPALLSLLRDEDSLVASLAGNALAAIGGPAVPALIEAAWQTPPAARILAVRALAEIKDPRAIPTLLKLLEENSSLLHYWAEEGLQRLGLNMILLKLD
ncbi:MAG: HEAT repeat domain-containing protein [Anaerolineae bacterium]